MNDTESRARALVEESEHTLASLRERLSWRPFLNRHPDAAALSFAAANRLRVLREAPEPDLAREVHGQVSGLRARLEAFNRPR